MSYSASLRGSMNSTVRTILISGAKVSLSAALLWVIASYFDTESLRNRISQVSPEALAAALCVMVAHIALSTIRWRAFILHLGGRARSGATLSGVLLERLVTQFVPSPVIGDAARVLELTRMGEDLRIITHSVILDRIFSIAGTFGVLALAAPLAIYYLPTDIFLVGILLTSAMPLLSLVIVLGLPKRFWEHLKGIRLIYYPIRLILSLRTVVKDRLLFLQTASISVIAQSLIVAVFFIIARNLDVPLTLASAFIAVPLIMLASFFPVSIAGWGTREGAALLILSQFGVSTSDAFAISVLFGLLYLLTACLCGVAWLLLSPALRSRRGSEGVEQQKVI